MNSIELAVAGFLAQLVDGMLGMAFGVTANTLLQAVGLHPAISSATIHTAEVFLTAANGVSHLRLGNFNRGLFIKLILAGVPAAVIGAYILTGLTTPWFAKAVQVYLLSVGFLILARTVGVRVKFPVNYTFLGAIGALADAIGGGGWGPIVTGTLLVADHDPRTTIGTVNAAEFLITLSQSIVFLLVLRITYVDYLFSFMLGGLVAAPLGALLLKHLNERARKLLFILVAVTLIVTNLVKIFSIF